MKKSKLIAILTMIFFIFVSCDMNSEGGSCRWCGQYYDNNYDLNHCGNTPSCPEYYNTHFQCPGCSNWYNSVEERDMCKNMPSCPGWANENNNGNTGKKETKQVLKFSVGGSKALAVVDEESDRSAVRSAARNATTDSMIMKILEDGSMESFITIPEDCNGSLSTINYIAQSPADDANEIYIVFNNTSWFEYRVQETATNEFGETYICRDYWESTSLGQLICVSADGRYDDILQCEDGTWKWLSGSSKDSIAFDNQGNMYYLVQESSSASYTNMIYKYDPKTKKSSQLTAPVENTYYDKFQISADGKWIFVKASRWSSTNSTNYLRVIPTDDPNKFENLFYSSGNSGWINDWIYDDDANSIYYNLSGSMYQIPEVEGKFSKDNRVLLFSGDSSSWFSYDHILDWKSSTQEYKWSGSTSCWANKTYYLRNPETAEQEVQYDQIVAYLFDVSDDSDNIIKTTPTYKHQQVEEEGKGKLYCSWNDSDCDYENQRTDTWFYYDSDEKLHYYNGNEVSSSNKPSELYPVIVYEYQKDSDDNFVLDEDNNKIKLIDETVEYYNPADYEIRFDLFAEVEGFELLASETEGLSDAALFKALSDKGLLNLFASLFDSDRYSKYGAGFFNQYEHNFFADVLYNKNTGKIINPELFRTGQMIDNLFYTKGLEYHWFLNWGYSNGGYTWKDDYTKTTSKTVGDNIQTQTVVNAEKVLEKLATYCSTKKIDFKLTAFKNDTKYSALYTDLINEEAIEFLDNKTRLDLVRQYMDENWDGNNGHGKFLYVTCFKEGTDEPAYDWKVSNSSSIYWGCVSNFTTSYKSSLFGTYDNGLVRIIDEDGKADGTYVSVMKNYAVVSTLVSENGFYFMNAILDSTGDETGYHQLQYYSVKDGDVTNLFKNVIKDLEIVTFCAAGDYVYYSAVDGTSIVNEKIDINTLAVTDLKGSQKLSQIISVK